ncbi:carcinoembryonic antigen-related cell adhesion molecule 16 [Microcaecilia unicolor]|uniref:Carcinoembryonic antigen-related cell adhesion molecule 16-like n=1 Tax=Microcaecilia unicolor TaxID=1415580 RepID=A0A6P7YW69_9AMPH|nr:carcinoembryonic antigen-related cell adhesion molecule 16-like [Microcaecilia unicolor]
MEFVFCRRCLILTVFLGLWSWQLSAQISVVPIPKTAVVGANVLLSVSGVTGHIMFFSWHKGESIQENQMLSYVQTATPPQETFPPYEGRVRGFPNCSMEILGVNTNDNGSYTVNIHTMGGHQHIATVTIIVYAFLGLWRQRISAQISVVPIPKTAMVGENVLLSVSGVTGNIVFFSWHRGECIQENLMLSYVPTATPPEQTFPPYEGRVRGFPNCSMEISGVNIIDNGSYTVNIQTRGGKQQHQATVTIIVYASSVEQPDRTLQIAVGAAIGAVLGAALIITTAVLLYKKGGKCQRKENGIGGNLFEVPDVSRAPPHQYSNIIPQNHEGINVNNHHFHINKQDKSAAQINTLNPKAPDSTYTDLLFKNQSVYTELKR